MEVKVCGPGCARCVETEKAVRDVVAARGLNASVIKMSDMLEMAKMGILSTPAVVVDGVVKCSGRVPAKDEIAAWLDGAPASGPAAGGGCSCGGAC